MYTIDHEYIYEQTIKKSKFICYLKNISTVEEAKTYLQEIRNINPDANHYCYSYVLGENALIYKNSDDGEPSQCAGIVIYEVLNKNQLTNIICIVVRYFGGIKLGASGLVRAYGSSAGKNIKQAKKNEIINYQKLKVIIDYPYVNEVLKVLDSYENINKTFLSKVCFEYILPTADIDNISQRLIDITKNNIKIEVY